MNNQVKEMNNHSVDSPSHLSNLMPENTEPEISDNEERTKAHVYGISDPAPWSLAILSGLQQFLTMIGGTIPVPYLLFPVYCLAHDDPARADINSSMYFVFGIVTILQSAIGCRLPLMQGSTFTYLIPIFAVLRSPEWKCPNADFEGVNVTTVEFPPDIWRPRLSLIQGSLMVASLFETCLGFFGLIGLLLRFITPMVVTPVLSLVGLAMLEESIEYCSTNWAISSLTVLLIVLFSETLKHIHLPCLSYNRTNGFHRTSGIAIFQLFPVLMVIIIVWILCYVLTVTNAISEDDAANTNLNVNLLTNAKWFRIPYPTQWGKPSVSWVGVIGMVAATMANLIESVGNYYTCARVTGSPTPPIDAINRGIFVEGVGNLFEGMLGIGNGCSTYAENIGLIGMTKMGSRRVMYAAGAFMILLGVFTKMGALFMTIPTPIIGGVFVVLFSGIVGMGIGNLQYVDLNSSRNAIVIGIPLFCGLSLPNWMRHHGHTVHTGNEVVDSIIVILLTNKIFVGGILGLILDNIIPGSDEERGIHKWTQLQTEVEGKENTDYDLPCGTTCIKNSFLKYLPIMPGFATVNGLRCCRKKNWNPNLSDEVLANPDPEPDVVILKSVNNGTQNQVQSIKAKIEASDL